MNQTETNKNVRNATVTVALLVMLVIVVAPLASSAPVKALPQRMKAAKATPAAVQVTISHLHRSGYLNNPPSPARLAQLQQLNDLINQGMALEQAHDYAGATAAFAQANTVDPQDKRALYGLADCAGAIGDVQSELNEYRRAVYTDMPPPYARVIDEGNVSRLMAFVLLLDKTGQAQEAVSVYDCGANLLNFDPVNGKQAVDVVLPQFGDGPGQMAYTPEDMEAMAHLAIGVTTNDNNIEKVNTLDAVTLAPDSAAARYYWGKYLLGSDDAGAKAALEQAVQLGDDQTIAAAKVYLKCLR